MLTQYRRVRHQAQRFQEFHEAWCRLSKNHALQHSPGASAAGLICLHVCSVISLSSLCVPGWAYNSRTGNLRVCPLWGLLSFLGFLYGSDVIERGHGIWRTWRELPHISVSWRLEGPRKGPAVEVVGRAPFSLVNGGRGAGGGTGLPRLKWHHALTASTFPNLFAGHHSDGDTEEKKTRSLFTR